MKLFRIEHKNCFREWVVAKDAQQGISFLEQNRFHKEDFSYTEVKAVVEETNFRIQRNDVDSWPFSVDSVPFNQWAETLDEPVLLKDSSDTWGYWSETVSINGIEIKVEFSSGIYQADDVWVCLVWEKKKEVEWDTHAHLLSVCSTFDHAKEILRQRAQMRCDIDPYDYFFETYLVNKLG